MIFVLYFIVSLYCLAILTLIYGFSKVKTFEGIGLEPKTKFSIIVPFRNEAENLPQLLKSLSNLNYPDAFFEVILVDDESEEPFQVPSLRFKIVVFKNNRVTNSPKKDAILTAISKVKNEWMITTDADCVVDANWLSTLDAYIQNHSVAMLAGAVRYDSGNGFLQHFQELDLASLQGATIGSFGINKGFMCNGANFAYTQSFFKTLNGFEGNDAIASGDDVFLLQKAIGRFPDKVHYLKATSNIVLTKAVDDWKSLFFQRVRWASKTSSYQSSFGKGLGLLVFGGNCSWLLVAGCWLLGYGNSFGLFFLLLKIIVDAVLIYQSHQFLTKNKMQYLVLSSLFYPFFSTAVALYSLFGKYEWKGRSFRK